MEEIRIMTELFHELAPHHVLYRLKPYENDAGTGGTELHSLRKVTLGFTPVQELIYLPLDFFKIKNV